MEMEPCCSLCGWCYGMNCGVGVFTYNLHCWNSKCCNSFYKKHSDGYYKFGCCNMYLSKDNVDPKDWIKLPNSDSLDVDKMKHTRDGSENDEYGFNCNRKRYRHSYS